MATLNEHEASGVTLVLAAFRLSIHTLSARCTTTMVRHRPTSSTQISGVKQVMSQ